MGREGGGWIHEWNGVTTQNNMHTCRKKTNGQYGTFTEWGKPIAKSKAWRDLWRWHNEEVGGGGRGLMEGPPIKGTVHNSAVTYTSTRRQYVRAAPCDMCWCRVSLWRQRRMHSMSVVTWGEAVRSSHSLSLSLSVSSLIGSFVFHRAAKFATARGWEVTDTQRTRTAPRDRQARVDSLTQRRDTSSRLL